MARGWRTVDFKVSAGLTVRASSASIAFLWSNWDVLYAFRGDRIYARVESDNTRFPGLRRWYAKGLGGRGSWWLAQQDVGVQQGRFSYFTQARSLMCPLEAETTLEYNRIDSTKISYWGYGKAAVPTAYFPLHSVLRLLASRITLYISEIGGEVAQLITERPEEVLRVAGKEAFDSYQKFIEEERSILSGENSGLKIFTSESGSRRKSPDDLRYLESKLDELEARLDSLHSKILKIDDYRASLFVFPKDHNLALIKNSKIVNRIVEFIYENEVGESPQNKKLTTQIKQIRRKSLNVPETILTLMATVADLGDPNAKSLSGLFDVSVYHISFEATLGITEWFFLEYLGKGVSVGRE